MTQETLTALTPGTRVRVLARGPWHGRIGTVISRATGGEYSRLLVAGLDPTMPRLTYAFGAQELQGLSQEEVPHG